MNEPIIIRKEILKDYPLVFALTALAFRRDNEARLVEALRQNESVFVPELSLVACSGNELAGHILFTKIAIQNIDGRLVESLALAPVSVLPEWQNKGIGKQLVKEGLAMAKKMEFESVVVLGHAAYYPRFGFKPASTWNIKAPFEVKLDSFMAIELQKESLGGLDGVVVYPNEFYNF